MAIYSSIAPIVEPADFVDIYRDAARFWATDGVDQAQIKVFVLNTFSLDKALLTLKSKRFSGGLLQGGGTISLRVTITGPQTANSGWAITAPVNLLTFLTGNEFSTLRTFLLGKPTFYANAATDLIYQLPVWKYKDIVTAYEAENTNHNPDTGALIPFHGLCGIFQKTAGGVYRVAFTLFRYADAPINLPIAPIDRLIIYEFPGVGGGGLGGANIPVT